jgi:hypothetical protein
VEEWRKPQKSPNARVKPTAYFRDYFLPFVANWMPGCTFNVSNTRHYRRCNIEVFYAMPAGNIVNAALSILAGTCEDVFNRDLIPTHSSMKRSKYLSLTTFFASQNNSYSWVIWLTGLPRSDKTTIAYFFVG